MNRKVDKVLLEDYASDLVTKAAQNGSASEGRPINLVSDTRIGMEHTGGYHSSSRSVVSILLLGGSKEFPLKTPWRQRLFRPIIFSIPCNIAQMLK